MSTGSSTGTHGGLRRNVLGSPDAVAQSLALLAPAIVVSLGIALGWLVAGLIVVGVLLVGRPEAVKGFGRAFVGARVGDGAASPTSPELAEVGQ